MHGRSRMAVDPRSRTMPGRSTPREGGVGGQRGESQQPSPSVEVRDDGEASIYFFHVLYNTYPVPGTARQ